MLESSSSPRYAALVGSCALGFAGGVAVFHMIRSRGRELDLRAKSDKKPPSTASTQIPTDGTIRCPLHVVSGMPISPLLHLTSASALTGMCMAGLHSEQHFWSIAVLRRKLLASTVLSGVMMYQWRASRLQGPDRRSGLLRCHMAAVLPLVVVELLVDPEKANPWVVWAVGTWCGLVFVAGKLSMLSQDA